MWAALYVYGAATSQSAHRLSLRVRPVMSPVWRYTVPILFFLLFFGRFQFAPNCWGTLSRSAGPSSKWKQSKNKKKKKKSPKEKTLGFMFKRITQRRRRRTIPAAPRDCVCVCVPCPSVVFDSLNSAFTEANNSPWVPWPHHSRHLSRLFFFYF